jgi:dihydrolipoamide dehydrogenase
MPKNLLRISLLALIVAAIYMFFHFGAQEYLSLSYLRENLALFKEQLKLEPVFTSLVFFIIYVSVAALSVPGATVLTLAAGALFGTPIGFIIVSFASTIGATLSFIASRFFLSEFVQNKFGPKIKTINEGIEKNGPTYLLSLRLLPIFPFFLINLVMGLTPIKLWKFFLYSQIGMIPGTFVYVNAGTQIATIKSPKDILSPQLIISFALLGLFPIIVNFIKNFIHKKKVYRNFKKPKQYDYNMIAIGAGSAGLVTSYIATAVNAKVALIEKHKMGGDCLNTGCVPSKAIIKSAKLIHSMKSSVKYGIKKADFEFDFDQVMGRVHNVIEKIEPHDSIERYSKLGVDCITGTAKIISPWEVEVNGKVITTKNITIATGASPFVPPIPGIKEASIVTSENLWELKELPEEMIVLGGGPIGLEMAQSFSRLGSNVTLVEMGPRVMSIEDEDVSEIIEEKLVNEGVNLLTNHKATEFKNGKLLVISQKDSSEKWISFDTTLVAVGRRANIKGFGAEEIGIEIRKNGTIEANDYLQTNFPNIYVCGDVTGPYQLTHTAAHQAWFCAVNALFGRFKKFRVDYSVIPWVTYTDPEVATVGKNELALKREGIEYEVTKYGIDDLDRAIADSEDYGMVKVLTAKGSDKILGATIVGQHASDLLLEFIAAMKHGFGLNAILGTIHPYPTMGEANKYAAGMWKKARKPEFVLHHLRKFHRWERKGTPDSENSLNKVDA